MDVKVLLEILLALSHLVFIKVVEPDLISVFLGV